MDIRRRNNVTGHHGGFSAEAIEELLEPLGPNHLCWSAATVPAVMGDADRPELGQERTGSSCAADPDMARVFARTAFTFAGAAA